MNSLIYMDQRPTSQLSDVEQALDLKRRILDALKSFPVTGEIVYPEDEAQWRFDAIRGLLLMALNDADAMAEEWKASPLSPEVDQ